jgi:hypothetical protein
MVDEQRHDVYRSSLATPLHLTPGPPPSPYFHIHMCTLSAQVRLGLLGYWQSLHVYRQSVFYRPKCDFERCASVASGEKHAGCGIQR